jgi:A118 family predicted phage portal protein
VGWQTWVKDNLRVDPAVPMAGKISEWWGWHRASNGWYSYLDTADDGRTFRVERISVKPAQMVSQEWASLILNEGTRIVTEDEGTNEWLATWLDSSRFLTLSQILVERCMSLGTGGWALRAKDLRVLPFAGRILPSPGAKLIAQRFDARHVFPLSYDEDECTECLFVSEVTLANSTYTQLLIHRLDRGSYVVQTVLLDKEGRPADMPGYAATIKTGSPTPLFALARTGLDNTYWEHSPFGVSVFDGALGAVKTVDLGVDSLYRDVWTGQRLLFLDERMVAKDDRGHVTIPREREQQFFRRAEMDGQNKLAEEFTPDLRVEDNRRAIITGLELLGARTGLGHEYFSLEGASGLMTATQVVADQSDLFRTIRKHENQIGPAIERFIDGLISFAKTTGMQGLPRNDHGRVRAVFDDSVIEDSGAQRKQDLEDVAVGAMPLWEYRAKWYAEDADTAKAAIADALSEGLPGEEF